MLRRSVRRATALAVVACALSAFGAHPAQAQPGEVARCLACHAPVGPRPWDAVSAVPAPLLGGQYAEYLFKQLRNFDDGDRTLPAALTAAHAVPSSQARHALAQALAGLPRFDASLPAPSGPGGPWGQPALPRGGRLYAEGDAVRNIPACQACHGPIGGESPGETAPRLAGQHRAYLSLTLQRWRSGERTNSRDGMMTLATEHLSDEDIDALSAYLASPGR